MAITKKHLEMAAPALQDTLDRSGMATLGQVIQQMFGLSSPEAAAGVVALAANRGMDSISLGVHFREAIELAGGREFPA